MEQKLTLNHAIAGAYPKAKVTLEGYDEPIFKIDEIDLKNDEFTLMRVSNGDVFHEPIYKCQLILTPLEKISDEHAVEVAKMLNYRTDIDMPELLEYMKDVINIRKVGDVFGNIDSKNIADNDVSPMIILRCYDYLRSKGYDCGHGNITSLISAGIAVEK